MVFIRKSDAVGSPFNMSFQLRSKEDVATVLDVYEQCLEVCKPEDIAGVCECNGFYICMTDDSAPQSFDFFEWLNDVYTSDGNIRVNCANARMLFPKTLSRGVYEEPTPREQSTSDFSEESETGCWDDELLPNEVIYLLHVAEGRQIPIEDEGGVLIGRSSAKAGYVVNSGRDLISRLHARVYLENGKCMVEDLGSKNGTFINNIKVYPEKDKELRAGDILRLADVEFKLA